jgi:hypothetical protein
VGERGGDGLGHLGQPVGGDQGAPDGGALLTCLDRHLGHQRVDEQSELGGVRTCVRAEDRAVERVGLGVEAG